MSTSNNIERLGFTSEQYNILTELLLKCGVLSDIQIEEELGKDVIIHPFNKAQLQPASYDIRLGKFYYRYNPECKLQYFHPENGQHVVQYWNVNPDKEKNYGALQAYEVKTSEEANLYGVNVGDEIIVIQPRELILGHTIEFIGSKGNIRPDISARSTMGRCGVTIAKCSGSGDPNYYNIWTLEIENHSKVAHVLKVGERVGHIKFSRTGPVGIPYNQKGNYQSDDSLEELIKNWSPLNMIPSAGAKLIRKMEKTGNS
jgi:deoxycytidine triphosphate deaminase